MATVTQLVDHVCRETGLDADSGSDDRIQALRCINRSVRRISIEVPQDFYTASEANLTPSASGNVNLATGAPGMLRITEVYAYETGDDARVPLDRITVEEMMELRGATAASGTPTCYAADGRILYLDAFTSTTGVYIRYESDQLYTAQLAEGGAEASIPVHPAWHEELVGTLACCYALEGYEGQEDRAAYYRQLVYEPRNGTMTLYKREIVRNGGKHMPRFGGPNWSTPAPSEAR